ncbi:MAG TPA: cation:proton antiporter [Parafilimonas sp.]|nr:cation:proton antiporter [Parafilimonas sp.]
MKRKGGLVFYISMIGVFGFLMYLIIRKGHSLETTIPLKPIVNDNFFSNLFQFNTGQPLPVLLLQVIVIIVFVRVAGFFFRKTGQPAVIGEIVAGIVLGPSVLGLLAPDVSAFIFPANSLTNLQFMSQIGLILFMFIVGLELDATVIRKQAKEAVIISHASIIIPYALGMALALFMYKTFAPPGVSFLSFSLFMGIATSITAFPVLARIIQERKLTQTKLGNLAITCAAADDVTAWCILAALIGIAKAGTSAYALYTIGLLILYVIIMILVVRPVIKKIVLKYSQHEMISKSMVAIVFMIMLLSAYVAELIGIHALFGAFLAGAIMPEALNFRKILIHKIEDVSIILLLPLFFVFTGLRTQITLLNDAGLWITFIWVVAAAVGGKFGGSALAAKAVGQSWKDSLSIGALMNTRGLMELVALNIGYDLGILSPQLFAMMVLMALATTLMTNPALNLINRVFK